MAGALAIDQMGDRFVGDLAQIGFEPSRRVGMDRVHDDDASACHGDQREVEIVLEAIHIAGDFGDGAFDVLGRSAAQAGCAQTDRERGGGHAFHEEFHRFHLLRVDNLPQA